MLVWDDFDVAVLDMDGTLLDLYFDSHFWLEYLPRRYAEHYAVDTEQARREITPRLRAKEGTLEWYCLDYWSREFGLDLADLKRELKHLIKMRPHAEEFLSALRQHNKRIILATNAHRDSLALKFAETDLPRYLDSVVVSHDFGYPKEDIRFWHCLQRDEALALRRTLFIDDNHGALSAARNFGIAHLFAVHLPDSRGSPKITDEFPLLYSFRDILPAGGY